MKNTSDPSGCSLKRPLLRNKLLMVQPQGRKGYHAFFHRLLTFCMGISSPRSFLRLRRLPHLHDPHDSRLNGNGSVLLHSLLAKTASLAAMSSALLCVSSVTGGGILIFRCWHLKPALLARKLPGWKPSLGEKEASSCNPKEKCKGIMEKGLSSMVLASPVFVKILNLATRPLLDPSFNQHGATLLSTESPRALVHEISTEAFEIGLP